MTLLWKEVDRMPNIWCLEFYGKHGMAEGPWLRGATWEEAAMDCMWHCILSMPDCCGLKQGKKDNLIVQVIGRSEP
ncbi:hypothetical protein Pyn_25975 [Prunus yedoensis var. nudiflora]|uniref:Uncharacterized protein n=1 Tax=Prunus yedoensis var. nudiflora TaxID=2094558 RepID=A0A314YK70_PRUYE|nr:hypothetical protein Pyn_25975 [Prunus yedoensis var. nudiflora]